MLLKTASLNCWGLLLIAKKRNQRVRIICRYFLKDSSFDFITLQEIWLSEDYRYLRDQLSGIYPYSHHYLHGIVGSGLAIFSKYPILETKFMGFSINGLFYRLDEGDWYSGKGLAFTKILVNNQIIHLYTTHLHAAYGNANGYLAYRLKQTCELVEWLNGQSKDYPTIITGDFNTTPENLAYSYFIEGSGMETVIKSENDADCWTFNRPKNTFHKSDHKCQRLDYIFYRGSTMAKWKFIETKIIDGDDKSLSFSDHSLISMTLELVAPPLINFESVSLSTPNHSSKDLVPSSLFEKPSSIYAMEMSLIVEKEIVRSKKIRFILVFIGLMLSSLYLAGAIYIIVMSFRSVALDNVKVNATIFTIIILIGPLLLTLGVLLMLMGLMEIKTIIASFKEFKSELMRYQNGHLKN